MTINDIRFCVNLFSTELMESVTFCMLLSIMTPEQCRAARGLLDWSQAELAERAAVGIVTVRQFEAGAHTPRRATLDVIKRAFEAAGADFIAENGGGPGVRLREPQLKKG
jgi:transcriptional regulator with XRE-family HTH domain